MAELKAQPAPVGAFCRLRLPQGRDELTDAVLDSLVHSTLAFGVDRAVLHRPIDGDKNIVIVDLLSPTIRKGRIANFCERMTSAGFFAEVRCNPEPSGIEASELFKFTKVWESHDITETLRRRRVQSRIQIASTGQLHSDGHTITLNPGIVRDWIRSVFPESTQIYAIDFPEIRKQGDRTRETIAIVTCHVPPAEVQTVFGLVPVIRERFRLEVVLNRVGRRQTTLEWLEEHAPQLAGKTRLDENDLEIVRGLFRTSLRWRTPKTRRLPTSQAQWFSIDERNVVLREDLISFFKRRRVLGVRVAIPAITGHGSPGAFFPGRSTPAWIFEFRIERGHLIPIRAPRQAMVQNSVEYRPRDPELAVHKYYQKAKRNLGIRTDEKMVETLMRAVCSYAAEFVQEQGLPFLTPHRDEAALKVLQRFLEAEGFAIGRNTFDSKRKLLNIAKRLERKGAYGLHALIASQLTGNTIVSTEGGQMLDFKPQRGGREQINQYILYAAISGRSADALPEFVRRITESPVSSEEVGAYLREYEAERALAKQLRIVLGYIGRRGLLAQLVSAPTDPDPAVYVYELQTYAHLEAPRPNLEQGQVLSVQLTNYNPVRDRLVFRELASRATPEPR